MSTHAFLPPSGADAWRWCSLWPTMNERYPKPGDKESEEGDAAHWVNLCTMQTGVMPAIGSRAPNSIAITEAMLNGTKLWLKAIGPLRQTMHAERTVPAAFNAKNWGTPDLWELDGMTLRLFDYKFGHKLIEVFENWQLINYAALIMKALGIDGFMDQKITAEFVIVQPRGFHRDGPIRRWNVGPSSNLRPYVNQLQHAAALATDPTKIAGTVGAHCKYCPGRYSCDAALRNTYVSMDIIGSPVPLELSPAALGQEAEMMRRALALIEARYEGLKEQLRAVMMRGERVPNWQLSDSKGRERWKVPPEQVKAIAGVFGHQIAREEICTPAQARELGVPVDIVNALSEQPRGELQVKPDDGSMLRQLFGN